MVINNLVKQVINSGGSITPLVIPSSETNGTGLMNPSIYNDNGNLFLNLRHVNYTLYHCEGEQLFINRWGPLTYLNPENDVKLRTNNFFCTLNDDFTIASHFKVNTSEHDITPVWEFIGLEDGRVVKWDDKLYLCGVRRDVKDNGEGRMELSEIVTYNNSVKEINRSRIAPPNDPNSYCEKNWMPVTDMPYHFIKWTNPTELVKVDPITNTSETVIFKSQIGSFNNLRGGSQVIPYKGKRICIIHECDLWKNKLDQKDAKYTHRFVIWDQNWNIEHISDPFSFMGGEIEFCCGLTEYNDDLLVTFGFQDNAAYLLKMPMSFFDKFVGIKNKFDDFDWGANDQYMINVVSSEISDNKNIYEKYVKVKEGDVVVDIGANVGAFTYAILDKKPSKVYCIEPSNTLIDTLKKNTSCECTYISKAISDKTQKTKIEDGVYIYFNEGEDYETITFKEFLSEYDIDKIDFLKVDCEGGEYDIFTEENKKWILNNVKHITGEWHISGQKDGIDKFRKFRDLYLKNHPNYSIFNQHNGEDLKDKIFDENWLDAYGQNMVDNGTMIYITNEKPPLKNYWKTTKYPTLEITTSIPPKGCVVDCAFCPQRTLTDIYAGEKTMTLDNFKMIVDKLPKEIKITFSGFTEPFLNKQCADMLLYAHEQGHKISVFTTGVGMTVEDVDKIKNIPFDGGPNGGFCLHLPDEERIAKHPITKRYLEVLERFKEVQHEINGFYLMSMGPVMEHIRYIFPDAHTPEMWSRAGNLLGEAIIKPELDKIKDRFKHSEFVDKPQTCGCDEKLYHNVVLPNGDVSLCCMDYGLKQIIGNLYTQEYDDIIPEPKSCFLLCQSCENGVNP